MSGKDLIWPQLPLSWDLVRETHNNPTSSTESSDEVRDVNTILGFNENEVRILNKLNEEKTKLEWLLGKQHNANTIASHLFHTLSSFWIIIDNFNKLPSNLKARLEDYSGLTDEKIKYALAYAVSSLTSKGFGAARFALEINVHDPESDFLIEFKKRLSELVDYVKQESDKL